ncbi:MAG: phenylacetate-CoA oxygenase/reductase subunit PaaK [Saprospiraceae bacterium]
MSRFHSLKIKDIRQETAECVSLAFEVPESLREEFSFLPGQHLTLKTMLDGEDVRRNYSLCSCPSENEWRIAIKKIPGGKFSTYANEQLKVGDSIEVMPPIGKFTCKTDPAKAKHYLAFAAGSGITPVMSILKAVLKNEPESLFTLFYINQRTDTIIFKEELENLKNLYLQRFSLHHILTKEDTGSDLLSGRPTPEKIRQLAKTLFDLEDVDEYYICGPEEMIHGIKDTLQELGVDKDRIHYELFTTGQKTTDRPKWTAPADAVAAKITITIDGNTFTFDQSSPEKTILDAAHETGADLPFACKGGVCCTCKAKLLKGEAEMEVNYGLEPEEVEKGYILTCQAHPKTSEVVLSFDE